MPSIKRQFGDRGEEEAALFLSAKGYKIFDRNYRVRNIGEIDLIGEKSGRIIFFEVKTRKAVHQDIFPIQFSIGPSKKNKLRRVCEIYMMDKAALSNKEWQVDGVFVSFDSALKEKFHVEHIENILWDKYY